jgi:hypothetical protein
MSWLRHRRRIAPCVAAWVVAIAGATVGACKAPEPNDAPEGVEGSAAPLAPAVSLLPEAEPNDAPEQAMRVRGERPISGTAVAPDVDTLLVPAADGAVVFVVSATSPGTLRIDRPQDGVRLTMPVQTDSVMRVGPFVRASSIRVQLEQAGDWTFAVEPSMEPRCGFGVEPDSRELPGVDLLSVPSKVDGCISAVDDEDVYRLTGASLADVPGLALEVSGVPSVALLLRVETDAGTLLAELAAGPGEPIRLPNLAAPAHGDLFLRISSLSGANEQVPYTLELRRLPPLNGVIELEPNDDAVRATVVSGIQLINGYLHRPGDRDVYRLMAASPTVVRMIAQPPAGVDLQLEIPGGSLGTMTINDVGVDKPEQVCSLRIDDGDEGTVVQVTARSVGDANVEPYLLTFQVFDNEQWEVEPNDGLAELSARDYALGAGERPALGIWLDASRWSNQVSGYVFPPGDVDRFVIEVFADPRAAATYTSLTLRLEPNGPTDYALEVVDEEGAAVAMADNGTVGEPESVSLDLPAGRYFARVSYVRGESCDQPYRLSVLQTALPGTQVPAEPGAGDGSGEGDDLPIRDGGDVNNLDRSGSAPRERGMTREEAARERQGVPPRSLPEVANPREEVVLDPLAPSPRQPRQPSPRQNVPTLEPAPSGF